MFMKSSAWASCAVPSSKPPFLNHPGPAPPPGLSGGFDRSLTRVGVGIFEIATSPLPPYDPKFIAPNPAYPDSYKPGLTSCTTLDTDTYTGYSGGDVVPFIPGSRFKVFDN